MPLSCRLCAGSEYGLVGDQADSVVVEDIAGGGAGGEVRALHHAARELLAERIAEPAAGGPPVHVAIAAGPPRGVRVSEVARSEG